MNSTASRSQPFRKSQERTQIRCRMASTWCMTGASVLS